MKEMIVFLAFVSSFYFGYLFFGITGTIVIACLWPMLSGEKIS